MRDRSELEGDSHWGQIEGKGLMHYADLRDRHPYNCTLLTVAKALNSQSELRSIFSRPPLGISPSFPLVNIV